MKFIGQMKDGSRLVIMAESELDTLVEQASIISSMVLEIAPENRASASVVRNPVKHKVVAVLSKAKSRATRSRDKKCAICKKLFHDNTRTNTRKICSEICKKVLTRQSKKGKQKENASHGRRGSWESRYKALPPIQPTKISTVNLSDPFLSPEQREKLNAERLAGIRARQP